MTPQPPPGAFLEHVQRAVSRLREGAPGEGAAAWDHPLREEVIAGLDAAIQVLTVYRGQILLAHRQDGHWGSVRDRDYADYRSRSTGEGRGAALGELELAEGLAQMPALARAVDSGELHLEHTKVLGRLRRSASPEVRTAMEAGELDELVTQATQDGLTAPELGKTARAWAATVDAAAAQAGFDAVRRRRSLTMRNSAGGVAGEFFLDPVAGEELRTALDAIAGRPAADDGRTREQRMADALTTLAGRTLQVGSDLNGAQVRPHLSLLVNEDTWTGLMSRRRRCESASGDRPPLPDVPPAELENGTLVPLGELERLMCDSEVTRMVMSAEGVPLDVGRTQRTYSKELRRAVTSRDRHCQWPGCRLRASWCEVHHITWFSRGGVTSMEEGMTACSYHHHRIHELDVRITVLADGFDFHFPDGTHIGTSRRGSPPGSRLPVACAQGDRPARSAAPCDRPVNPAGQPLGPHAGPAPGPAMPAPMARPESAHGDDPPAERAQPPAAPRLPKTPRGAGPPRAPVEQPATTAPAEVACGAGPPEEPAEAAAATARASTPPGADAPQPPTRPRSAPVQVRMPSQPRKAVARRPRVAEGAMASWPSTYAAAPTRWSAEPPF
ncbi:protein of unknown function [Georgenia satyanarayanai]|uniref:HNH nuclease domain-containing protein n=1 Tax=Georgenia satyanarayanai TaxID=860221 RepID=A0A2Y9A294_9MICO|nr:HNH endonuclease signature motif containing protein [Georgenia satyanarayanai]PYG01819.1 uncharacterized protein DUF222 [Georgenia satyanarayanai]SSA36619.1 protein of unknown function [Georgenia satyanarayanai]